MAEIYFDYLKMMTEINVYMEKYKFISVTGITQSILGNIIPAITIGRGNTVITYVGGERGCDPISPFLLTRFIRDICSLYDEGGAAFGFSAENILNDYTLVIIPMLNPDGSLYCSRGIGEDNPLKERIIKINNGNNDFSLWQGNARGIELSDNYGFELSETEPEPEVGVLCNFLRYGIKPDMLIDFSKSNDNCSEEKIFYGVGEAENKIAIALSQMSGAKRFYREGKPPRMSLSDWAIKEICASAFSIELSQLNCTSQKQFNDKAFSCYTKMRKLLFCAPFLNKIK